MTGLWILGAILLLICLLCLLRIRVSAEFGAETFLMLWIGPVRLKLYPRKERKEKRQEQKAEHRKKDSHRSIPKPTISDIRDACQALKPALIRALRRTRRGIRIDPLTLSLVLGGREDPAGTAELYGYKQNSYGYIRNRA